MTTDSLATSQSLASQLQLGFPILEDRDHRLGSAFDVYRLPMGMDMGPVDSHSVAWKRLAHDTMHVPVDQVIAAVKAA